ncbi:MAG: RNA polymerase sigma factor [Verrucomicrobiae bacterium]|nr:RNA polymerase sigma factor [Verrucomicrobiae bacterium]
MAGDEDALGALMRRHSRDLYQYLNRILKNASDATELVTEVFYRVYRHRLAFSVRSSFRGWLSLIAFRMAQTRLRWRERHPEFWQSTSLALSSKPARPRAVSDPHATPAEQAATDEWLGTLQKALQRIPASSREAIALVCFDGCCHKEAAARLRCTVKAVETRLYHGRNRLKGELKRMVG